MASPNITTETTAYMSYPVAVSKVVYNEQNVVSVDGTVFSYRMYNKKRREFTLSWSVMTASQFSSLSSFVDARVGGRDKFYFNTPTESDIPVLMVPESFTYELVGPGVWSASMRVVEVK